MFVVPKIQGGGHYKKGEAIINKNTKPKVIMILYEGMARECHLME